MDCVQNFECQCGAERSRNRNNKLLRLFYVTLGEIGDLQAQTRERECECECECEQEQQQDRKFLDSGGSILRVPRLHSVDYPTYIA